MKGTVSGWKRLSNGGVIESKIWPTLVSSNRACFSISTASMREDLWHMTVYQKFSPTEKGIEGWWGICWGGKRETKDGFEDFRKRSWEGSRICSPLLVPSWLQKGGLMFCITGLVEMWVGSQTEGEASENTAYPALPVPLELALLLLLWTGLLDSDLM